MDLFKLFPTFILVVCGFVMIILSITIYGQTIPINSMYYLFGANIHQMCVVIGCAGTFCAILGVGYGIHIICKGD